MPPTVLGLDIGGANLKAADTSGSVRTMPFAVWKNPAGLAHALTDLVREFGDIEMWAVTMTAELCDCFASKSEGVHAILDAVVTAAGACQMDPERIRVWQNNGCFVDPEEARRTSLKTAAANWLALASYVARRHRRGPALLIDVGSTTTDVIAIDDDNVVARGRTDLERLANQELLYEGVLRTPVCAVVSEVRWHGRVIKPAAELFATTLDAFLLLGDLPENAADRNTADGRPATRDYSHARLARMLCADAVDLTPEETLSIAEQIKEAQLDRLAHAMRGAGVTNSWTIYVTGAGAFLARQAMRQLGIDRLQVLDAVGMDDGAADVAVRQAACAYAVAWLAREEQR